MKPLTLTIHPRLEDTNLNPDEIRQGRVTTLALMKTKRLTDAELAAEWHASEIEAWRDSAIYLESEATAQIEHRSATLLRFATSPHYFEEAA